MNDLEPVSTHELIEEMLLRTVNTLVVLGQSRNNQGTTPFGVAYSPSLKKKEVLSLLKKASTEIAKREDF